MKLLLVRHAQSQGNIEQVLQGQQEHPLSPIGHAQAQSLAQYLSSERWSPTHVYSSPLQRAHQTAQYCAGDRPIHLCPELLEIHNGVLQGLTWDQAQQRHPKLCQDLITSATWRPIPEAEYPEQVWQRSQGWIAGLQETHQNGDRLWVFSHGGTLQHLIAQILGCDRLWGIAIPPTGLFEFELDITHWHTQTQDRYTGHLFKILQFNQTPHLRQI